MWEHSQFICAECGFRAAAGNADCGALRDALLARDFQQPLLYWQYHRLSVDVYCLQHSNYVKSAKSLAAHLCGLCVALEHENDGRMLQGLQHWLSTQPPLEKPCLPSSRGHLTIRHVSGIEDPTAYGAAVREWARSTWEAYGEQQPLGARMARDV